MWEPITVPSHIPFLHRFVEPSLAAGQRPSRSQRLRNASTPELARRLGEILQEFTARCPNDQLARGWFLSEISRAAGALEGMVRLQPEVWKPLARKSVQWPVLATLNPRISLGSQQERLLGSLGLGRDAFLSMTRKSRTSIENSATRYALSILMTLMDNNRSTWPDCVDSNAPQWAKDSRKLPAFTARTWTQWWLVGKQAFLDAVPHPEEIEELGKLARMRQTAAEKRALILERISRVVKSLAPERTPAPPPTEG